MMKIKEKEEFKIRVIEEINEARTDPLEYARKIRDYKSFFKGNLLKIPETLPIITSEGPSAFDEAAEFLESIKPMKALKYSKGLIDICQEAIKSICKLSNIDEVTNIDFESITSKYGQIFGNYTQAVDFGSTLPELVVINLLVDDGDTSRGNRENILNPRYRFIGVATAAHKTYHSCTVLMYARHFFNLGEKVGELSDDNYEDVVEESDIPIKKERPRNISIVRKTSLRKRENEIDEIIEAMKDSKFKLKYLEVNEEYNPEDSFKKSKVSDKGFQDIPVKHIDTRHDEHEVEDSINKSKATNNLKGILKKNYEPEEEMDLPDDVIKIETTEKIIEEKGIKKKIIKKVIYKEDGSIQTDIYREKI